MRSRVLAEALLRDRERHRPGARRSSSDDTEGVFIACQCCARDFESRGWAYCPTCMELPAEERPANRKAVEHSGPAAPTGHRVSACKSSGAFPRKTTTEIIEEFPPIFGFSDFPSILVGPNSRRGRPLPPDLVETVLDTEIGRLRPRTLVEAA
jgi:hypothetical protein